MSIHEEEVNGIIIGGDTVPYEFWNADGRIARSHFANDESAIAWFKERYRVEFAAGAEMRVFDLPPKNP